MSDTVTTKIRRDTRENLQILSRITGEDQLSIMDRVIKNEMALPGNQKLAKQFVNSRRGKSNGK